MAIFFIFCSYSLICRSLDFSCCSLEFSSLFKLIFSAVSDSISRFKWSCWCSYSLCKTPCSLSNSSRSCKIYIFSRSASPLYFFLAATTSWLFFSKFLSSYRIFLFNSYSLIFFWEISFRSSEIEFLRSLTRALFWRSLFPSSSRSFPNYLSLFDRAYWVIW